MGSSNNISELAKQYGVTPSQVLSALQSLGVVHEGDEFLADSDEIELIKDSLESQRGKKILVVQDCATPRDMAQAIGVPPQDVVKNLMMKLKTMAQLTTSLKPDIIEKVAELYGCTLQWGVTEVPKPAAKPVVSRAKKVDEPVEVIRPPVVTIMGHVQPRKDIASRLHSKGERRGQRARRNHPTHRCLPSEARPRSDHFLGYSRPRCLYGDASARCTSH